MSAAYARLKDLFRRALTLRDAESVLHWDQAVMMPAGGAGARGDQLAAMKAMRHALLVQPATAELLAAARAEPAALPPADAANLAEMERMWRHAAAVPEDLVHAQAKAASDCEMVWREARRRSDFKAVLPTLSAMLGLTREAARAKASALGLSPYDALLDSYEPDGRVAEIDPLFADLGRFLPGFLGEAVERQARTPAPVLPEGPFPIERQRALAVGFMERLGFEFEHGRLDVSLHPFCGGSADDVRITTRYDEADFTSALMGVLHETGHALYERGLPAEWRGQPAGEPRGMVVHESQSLLIEMQVCRSRPFLAYAAPVMAEAFGGAGPAWTPDNLARLYARVEPGFIRVDADEVTYPAHIILRYGLEKALIGGEMEAADLPSAWNEGFERLLGLKPPSDREGCLQDIHWYGGDWGYFPTYTLGAIAAAQLFDAARRRDAAVEPGIAAGDFAPLLEWLRENVHARASLLSTREILVRATGRPLDPTVFKDHLRRRYLA